MAGGTFTIPTSSSAAVLAPPAGYYRFFIGNGTDNVLGTYYKKDSSNNVTQLVAAPYTDEQAQDVVAAMLQNSDGTITLNYNDAGNVESISVGTITSAKVSDFNEAAQDAAGSALTNTASITLTYNDGAGTISADVVTEAIQDIIGTLVAGDGTTVNTVYNDAANTFVISVGNITSAKVSDFTEAAQDAVGTILTDSAQIDFTYNDAANTITAVIFAGSISNASLSNMSESTIKGRAAGSGSGAPVDLTAGQVKTLLAIASTDITDFTEATQDAVGSYTQDSTTLDAVYNDASNTLTLNVLTQGLDLASASLKGLQSAADKRASDNFFNRHVYNVLDWGLVPGNVLNAATNVTAFNDLMAVIPDNATVLWPGGPNAYFVASALAIPAGKHLRQQGGGNQKTLITTTSATADIFTCGDWYQDFDGLKFTTAVTRTAGRAIFSGNNVAVNVYNCDFDSMWDSIVYSGGNSAGNLASVFNCNSVNGRNRFIVIDGTDANTIITQCVSDCPSGQMSAGLEINRCGSIIVAQCDFIRAVNNLKINPTLAFPAGVFSAYFVNVFFDTSPGSSVKLMGIGAIQRIKFVNCWFSGSVSGCEFASTATTLPTAIDFVNCDIFANSQFGIQADAVQDFSLNNCRVSGNATAGVRMAAAAGAVTKLNMQNTRVGPTAGFGANGIGLHIQAGLYGSINYSGNDLSGNTTNVSDLSSADTPMIAAQNFGLVVPAKGSITAQVLPAATVTRAGNPVIIPAGARPGTKVTITGRLTNTATIQTTAVSLRYGTNNTNADPTLHTQTLSAGTAALGSGEFIYTFVILSATTALYNFRFTNGNNGATGISAFPNVVGAPTAPLTISTVAQNFLGLYFSSTVANIVTIRSVECEVASQ